MIRFTCPTCGREYHLPEALARLALLCKGCGRRLLVPDASTVPEPPEQPPEHLADPLGLAGTVDLFPDTDQVRRPASASRAEFSLQDSVDLFPRSDTELIPSADEPALRPPRVESDAIPARPTTDRRGRGRVLGVAVDVAVGVLLAGVGLLLGEFATRRGTADILREAGSAPKFPPLDLVLWLGCVATPVLGYVLFANRGKSVGAWLRRR